MVGLNYYHNVYQIVQIFLLIKELMLKNGFQYYMEKKEKYYQLR